MEMWLYIGLYLIYTLPLFIIAQKSAHEYAWLAFVPLANLWLMCDMADVSPMLILGMLFPFVNILVYAYLWSKIAENTNKAPFWGILMVVPLVNIAVGFYLALYEPDRIR